MAKIKNKNVIKMSINQIIAEVTQRMDNKQKRKWVSKLLDKDDNSVSSSTFLSLIICLVGIILLFVPAFALTIESWYNHTITTDLSGMAAYIGACTAIFTVAAGLKGWVSHNDAKTKVAEYNSNNCTIIENENIIEEDENCGD